MFIRRANLRLACVGALAAILAGTLVSHASDLTTASWSGVCDTQLTVVSFNVRFPTTSDGKNYWENRKTIFMNALQEMNPDIFGLQEAYYMQSWHILERMPGFEWFGRDRYGIHSNEHMSVFYNTAKLELLESGDFWLSDKPNVPASMTWGNTLPRMVTWGLFRYRATGQQFYFYNTHFHHTGDASLARNKSAELIASRVLDLPADVPVILTGDLNTTDSTDAYRILAAGADPVFRDTRKVAAQTSGPTGTAHSFTGSANNRIDYIMVRGNIDVLDQAHITYNESGRYPSDHFPVKATLRLCSALANAEEKQ